MATTHETLADLALAAPCVDLLDLGCGSGTTLERIATRDPEVNLTGLDLDPDALHSLVTRLPRVHTLRHDLAEGMPLPTGGVDVVLCHNTLECLLNPAALLTEIHRVLRPHGRAVLGHTDFETIVVTTADRDLARRVLLTYAQLPVLYRHMAAADPQMGRRLPGLVRHSPLHLTAVQAHTTVTTALEGAALARTREIEAAVRRSARRGLGHVDPAELDRWTEELHAADAAGDFLFSETAYLLTATPQPPTRTT